MFVSVKSARNNPLADNGGDNDIKHNTRPHTLRLLGKDHLLHTPARERMRGGKKEEEMEEPEDEQRRPGG